MWYFIECNFTTHSPQGDAILFSETERYGIKNNNCSLKVCSTNINDLAIRSAGISGFIIFPIFKRSKTNKKTSCCTSIKKLMLFASIFRYILL